MQVNDKQILVIGSGIMGSGITQVCVEAGYTVLIFDTKTDISIKAKNNIKYFINRKVEKGLILQEESENIIDRIQICDDLLKAENATIVIEAATENISIKKEVFENLSKIINKDAIFASNTSTISITLLGSFTDRPEKVIGMHFFIPAPLMKLIEIIPGIRTAEETIDTAFNFAKSLGKVPIKAPDSSAFIVNRLLLPMWNEAIFLVMEGNKPEDIDNAMKLGANLPMGPLELADFAGLDTVLSVLKEMHKTFGEDKYRPCPLLIKMVQGNLLGKKTGKGFYNYEKK